MLGVVVLMGMGRTWRLVGVRWLVVEVWWLVVGVWWLVVCVPVFVRR